MSCGGGTNTVTQQSNPPSQFLDAYQKLVQAGQAQAQQPLQQYGGPMVAGFTPQQQQAFSTIQNAQGLAQPYINSGAGLIGASAAPITPNGLITGDQLSGLASSGLNLTNRAGNTGIAAAGAPGVNMASGYGGSGAGLAGAAGATANAAASTDPSQVSRYFDPYLNSAVQATQAQFNNQNKQTAQGITSNAIKAGAFGGDRADVAQGIALGQEQLAQAPVIAGMESQGYQSAQQAMAQQDALRANTALGAGGLGISGAQLGANTGLGIAGLGQQAAGQEGQLGLSAAQQLYGLFGGQQQTGLAAAQASGWLGENAGAMMAGLGSQSENAALTGASANLQAGGQQQQLAQEQLNIPYEQFLAQQAYPYQQLQFLAGLTTGAGSQAGGSSSTTGPGPSLLSQLGGLGLSGVGLAGATGGFGSNGWLTNLFGGGAGAGGGSIGVNGAVWKKGGRVGYDDGGMVSPTYEGSDPQTQSMFGQFAAMPEEKLRELAVRLPPNTAQGAMVRKAIMQKQMMPGLAGAEPTGMRAGGRTRFPTGGAVNFTGPKGLPTFKEAMANPDAFWTAISNPANTPTDMMYLAGIGHMADPSNPAWTQNEKMWGAVASVGPGQPVPTGPSAMSFSPGPRGQAIPSVDQSMFAPPTGWDPGGGAPGWFQPMAQYQPPGTTVTTNSDGTTSKKFPTITTPLPTGVAAALNPPPLPADISPNALASSGVTVGVSDRPGGSDTGSTGEGLGGVGGGTGSDASSSSSGSGSTASSSSSGATSAAGGRRGTLDIGTPFGSISPADIGGTLGGLAGGPIGGLAGRGIGWGVGKIADMLSGPSTTNDDAGSFSSTGGYGAATDADGGDRRGDRDNFGSGMSDHGETSTSDGSEGHDSESDGGGGYAHGGRTGQLFYSDGGLATAKPVGRRKRYDDGGDVLDPSIYGDPIAPEDAERMLPEFSRYGSEPAMMQPPSPHDESRYRRPSMVVNRLPDRWHGINPPIADSTAPPGLAGTSPDMNEEVVAPAGLAETEPNAPDAHDAVEVTGLEEGRSQPGGSQAPGLSGARPTASAKGPKGESGRDATVAGRDIGSTPTGLAPKSNIDASGLAGAKPRPEEYQPGRPAPWMSLLTAGAAMMAGRSPYALSNIGAGIGAGAKEYERENELDAKPEVDHSGETVRIYYPSEKKWIDTGIPTGETTRTAALKEDSAARLKQTGEFQTQRLALENRNAARQEQATAATIANSNAHLRIAQEQLEQGRYSVVPGMGEDPNDPSKQVQGAYRINGKTGATEFVPGMTLTNKGSGTGTLSTDAVDMLAQQTLAGDTTAVSGLGFGNAGAANRAAVKERVAALAKERGMSGADIAAVNAGFFGTKAGERVLGGRTANIGMAVTEAKNLTPLALEASNKVDRTQFPTLNSMLLATERGTGDENVVRLGIATNSLINAYARGISPTGVPTVSDKDHARELLSTAWSKGQYNAGVDQLIKELNAAAASPAAVRQEFRDAVHEGQTAPSLTAPKPGEGLAMPATKADLVKGKSYNTSRGLATWDGTQFVQ